MDWALQVRLEGPVRFPFKSEEPAVPTGKVRFFDADKGFGFIAKDGGGDVYVRSNALADGLTTLRAGQRVEFGVMEGRRGEQALAPVTLLEAPPSLSKATRKKPEQMAVIVEDLIKMLDQASNDYQHGRHPKHADKIAAVLRRVADELEL